MTWEYALEADPGRLTASFPTFDTVEDAIRAATVPAMEREGLPPPRILRRTRWESLGTPAEAAVTSEDVIDAIDEAV